MAYREDILRDETFKDQCEDDEHRVFYSLTTKSELTSHRVAKALSLVIVHLKKKGLLNDEELDELLLDTVR